MFKQDFPILSKQSTVYLDTAASAQKPEVVLRAMDDFYRADYANVHRGNCALATRATERYESARQTVAAFIHACPDEIVFTKGATESINLVASGYAQTLNAGDDVLICIAEHHASFVPWQQACLRSGATVRIVKVLPSGKIDLDDFRAQVSTRTKMVVVAQMSNVLGVMNPIREMADMAHDVGAKILVDGAQSVAHTAVDVRALDCDFFAFSGHKLYGPTGIGVLYGKKEALAALPPYQFGGDMIRTVTVAATTFADVPARFEAGTPPIAEAIGLEVAIRYIQHIGLSVIEEREAALSALLWEELSRIRHFCPLGDSPDKKGIVSFNIKGVHPSDIAFGLAQDNICVRVGHQCAMPLHTFFGCDVSLRVSLGLYNDEADIDAFIRSFRKVLSLLGEG